MTLEEEKSLDLLRDIFLSESNTKIEEFEKEIELLREELNSKEASISSLYPIIGDLLERKIVDSKDEIARVLSPVMGIAIKKQVSESKNDIIDALYPIIGETIRKSVSASIKEIYDSINKRIETALTTGLLDKKIKSKITGVSTNDLIIKDSFPFRIKEIFLIHENSGILISHLSALDEELSIDGDIISGMLTAIKDFVSESFKSDVGSQNLYEIQYGESKIILNRGRYSYLALVVSGQEPVKFNDHLSELNTIIHNNYHKQLRSFDGNISNVKEIDRPIRNFIDRINEEKPEEDLEKSKPYFAYLLVAFLVLFLIIIGIIKIPQYLSDRSLNQKIDDKLGSVNWLSPKDISFTNDDGEVLIKGSVSSFKIRNKIDSLMKTIPEIHKLHNELDLKINFVSPEIIAVEVQNLFNNQEQINSSDISFQIIDNLVFLEGEIESQADKLKLGYLINEIPGVMGIVNNIETVSILNLSDDQAINYLNELNLYFEFGKTVVTKNHKNKLDKIIPFINRTPDIKITIKGYSDDLGTIESRKKISLTRAENVLGYLQSQGINRTIFTIQNSIAEDNTKLSNERHLHRRVEFILNR